MSTQKNEEIKEETTPISLAEFLESVAPGTATDVNGLAYFSAGIAYFSKPGIQLHCPSEKCNGLRFFRCKSDSVDLNQEEWRFFYTTYLCSNCRETEKVFSLAAYRKNDDGKCYKFGELPNYGPPTPARLMKLIGSDRDLFLKGRRCENQGLGIGAFVYYRRVIESQKNRILDEIIKVSKKIGAPCEAVEKLEAAKAETRFTVALGSVKDAIPQALLINGHNPLLLLHSALSNGLHDQSDEHCLEIAASVRIVLGDLSERLSQALKNEAELTRALSKLMPPCSG